MNTQNMVRLSSTESEPDAFDRWHARHTHDDGRRKTPDKARVAAINHALEAILNGPSATVSAADLQSWILKHLGFGESVLSRARIDEHCLYEAGEPGTPTKKFSQPLKDSTLRIVGEDVYALAEGAESYTYREISHRRKSEN